MKHRPTSIRPRVLILLAASLGAVCLLASCSSSSSAPSWLKSPLFLEKPRLSLSQPRAVVPSDFLFSWHKPYNEWMDTPNRVYYHEVPLDKIFQNPPFTKLRYTLGEMPPEMPEISIDSLGITRRQLLWMIAHDNQLHMSLMTDSEGYPTEVIIRWRGLRDNDKVRLRRGIIDPKRLRDVPETQQLDKFKRELKDEIERSR